MNVVLHLRYFLTVAEELHFGRAAARLHMSQPPLSQCIRRLEKEFGAQLFDRSGGRVTLTAAGAVLVDEARDIVGRLDAAYAKVRAISDQRATLRVGVPVGTPSGIVAALVSAADEIPVDVDVEMLGPDRQMTRLARGDLDVGVLDRPADGFAAGAAITVVAGVVLSRRSPLAARTELRISDLAGYDLVVPCRDDAPVRYDQVVDTCRRHAFTPSRTRSVSDLDIMLGLVAAGRHVAFDVKQTAYQEPRVAWRPLAGAPLSWSLVPVWPRSGAHPAAPAIVRVVRQVLGGSDATPPLPRTARPREPWAVLFPGA